MARTSKKLVKRLGLADALLLTGVVIVVLAVGLYAWHVNRQSHHDVAVTCQLDTNTKGLPFATADNNYQLCVPTIWQLHKQTDAKTKATVYTPIGVTTPQIIYQPTGTFKATQNATGIDLSTYYKVMPPKLTNSSNITASAYYLVLTTAQGGAPAGTERYVYVVTMHHMPGYLVVQYDNLPGAAPIKLTQVQDVVSTIHMSASMAM